MRSVWLCRLTVGLLVVGLAASGVAWAAEDAPGAAATEPDDAAAPAAAEIPIEQLLPASPTVPVPADLYDRAFDPFVDLTLLGKAWDGLDPALLTDVALQLAEGERVLMRPHKAVEVDKLLAIAATLAGQKNDKTTLDRLAKAAELRGNQDLANRVAAAGKLAESSRGVEDVLKVGVNRISAQTYAMIRGLLVSLEAARAACNLEGLDQMQAELESLEGISEEQRDQLQGLIGQTRARIQQIQQGDKATLLVLGKLSWGSRYGKLVGKWEFGPRKLQFYPNGYLDITLPNGQLLEFKITHYNPSTGEIAAVDKAGTETPGLIVWVSQDRFTWYSPTGFRVYDRTQ